MHVRTESHGPDADHAAAGGEETRRDHHHREQGLCVLADGSGRLRADQRRPLEIEFRDEGRTAIVIGGGPSVRAFDAGTLGAWPCIVVNDGWRLVPDACAIWAADQAWWAHHSEAVREGFRGRRFGSDLAQCDRLGLEHRHVDKQPGLSRDWQVLRAGGYVGNSGAQAINLAFLAGARRILLFGFDMQQRTAEKHWFGSHPKGLERESNFRVFIAGMAQMASDLVGAGVHVINCSEHSALPYWTRANVHEARQLCAHT